MTSPHHNQQLFSDHYLDVILPIRQDWQALTIEAQPIMQQIAAIFKKYKPGGKEAQAEHRLVRPVLEALGHTFEIQPSLTTPEGTHTPDYVFYRDEATLNANVGKKLTRALLQTTGFAIGDAKHWDCPLDIALQGARSDLFTNKNPSYQIAFYMRHSGVTWGILTNGRLWRLYHKDSAEMLDHFYEVDLPALLASNDVKQFLYFYTFFRRAAFDQRPLGVGAILKESIDYAQGIGDSLKEQVYQALRYVAQGFLDYTANGLTPGDPTTLKDIYDNSLILLYRLLFIFYAEARDLLPMSDSELYRESYSLRCITSPIARDLDAGRTLRTNSTKLYHHVKELFGYINVGDPPLKISTFNGGLFDPRKHTFLEQYSIGDALFQHAIDKLARIDGQFIDYRDLSVRHLGTIYEGLLEYHLEKIAEEDRQDGWSIDLLNSKGERHATGSYYTPDYIVKYIVDQTLGPVLRAEVEQAASDKAKVEAVLAVKVLDPSMGSGHFLVEATEYIARFLVELNAQPPGTTKEAELAYWKRRVVQTCIYGVDLNFLAVELAKLSLWLSTVAKDRPLSFLDHHLRTGDALIGARLADLTAAPTGNAAQRKTKKQETPEEQLSLFDDEIFRQSLTTAVDLMWLVEDNPAQTIEQVKEQEQLYETLRNELIGKYGRLADLAMAAHYGLAIDPSLWKPLVDFATERMMMIPTDFIEWLEIVAELSTQHHFFHWELEFPEIFFDRHGQPKHTQAGVDAVIGNPPWVRQETFMENKAALKYLYRVYHGVADLYTYFMELGNTYLRENGRFGYIVPNKFVRAHYGETLRNFLATQVRLERVVDFGDLPVFKDATTYPMIVLTSKQPTDNSEVRFTQLKQLHPDTLAADITNGERLVSRSALTGSNWAVGGDATYTIVEKMRGVSVPLGQVVKDKILYGIKTGFNEAFVIDRLTRDKLIADDPKSTEIIKPFVMGRDVKRYSIDYQDRYIILSKIGTPIERYPAIFAHLQQYQARLEARWDKGEHWWELRACDYYEEFEKPKILWPVIAVSSKFAFSREGYYSNDKTFFIPTDDLYLLAILNSSTAFLFFRSNLSLLRGGFFEYRAQTLLHTPIRRIAFTTPADESSMLAKQSTALYKADKHEELLAFVDERLAATPEQSDVVHDLLVYLAEQMIELNKQRQSKVEDFTNDLYSVYTTDLQKIARLWTPLNTAKEGSVDTARRLVEAQKELGPLATRQLELREDAGSLSEAQWRWLLVQRLGHRSNLSRSIKVFREYQPSIAELDGRIAATDKLINQVVYRLYGLTPEEIAVVEGTN